MLTTILTKESSDCVHVELLVIEDPICPHVLLYAL